MSTLLAKRDVRTLYDFSYDDAEKFQQGEGDDSGAGDILYRSSPPPRAHPPKSPEKEDLLRLSIEPGDSDTYSERNYMTIEPAEALNLLNLSQVNILTKSSVVNADNSTLIGNRPCSSGIKSEGLAI